MKGVMELRMIPDEVIKPLRGTTVLEGGVALRNKE